MSYNKLWNEILPTIIEDIINNDNTLYLSILESFEHLLTDELIFTILRKSILLKRFKIVNMISKNYNIQCTLKLDNDYICNDSGY